MRKYCVCMALALAVTCTVFAGPDFTPQYKLGDEGPGGGIVFYVSEQGFEMIDGYGETQTYHYLEVSKTDLTTDEEFVTWCPCTEESGFHKWTGDIITDGYVGLKKWEMLRFTGKWNTYNFTKTTAHPGGAVTRKNCAAQMCYLYTTDTTRRGDWYLPGDVEAQLLYISAKYLISSPALYNDLRDYNYWCFSYDYGQVYAIPAYLDFNDGSINKANVHAQYSVRAIHAF